MKRFQALGRLCLGMAVVGSGAAETLRIEDPSHPIHDQTQTRLLTLDSRGSGMWHITDNRQGCRRDFLGLFNWQRSGKTFQITPAMLGLPRAETYIAFTYRGNALTPPFRDTLVWPVAPETSDVLVMLPLAGHPQLISASRHITPKGMTVESVQWHAAARTLSGVSHSVANERCDVLILTALAAHRPPCGNLTLVGITGTNGYELTLSPGEGSVSRPDDAYGNANTPDAPITTLFEPRQDAHLVRVAWISGSGGRFVWRVVFSGDPASNTP